MRAAIAGLGTLAVLAGLVGCSAPEGGAAQATPPRTGNPGDAASLSDRTAKPVTADRILKGDRITIIFSGIPSPPAPHEETIGNDGFITPPLLGKPVAAADRTKGELQAELLRLYVPAFYKQLTITVDNPQRFFSVGGFVAAPGRFTYLSETTLLTAIQAAGDVTIWAWRSHVKISRQDGRTEEYDLDEIIKNPNLDPPVYPGDAIHVPRRPF